MIESNIQNILVTAGKIKKTVSYGEIYALFADSERNTVWNTFENACRELADPKEAIYGVLMRKKGSEFPESGFFELFKNTRSEMYMSVTGNYSHPSNTLNCQQKKQIVDHEFDLVCQHASNL
jgi:plasmid replication initiation protein